MSALSLLIDLWSSLKGSWSSLTGSWSRLTNGAIIIGSISGLVYSIRESNNALTLFVICFSSLAYVLHSSTIIDKETMGKKFKLNEGEIRKAITITLTIIYIYILSYFFWEIYIPNVGKNLTSNAQIIGNATINLTAQAPPIETISNIMTNFLYVYLVVIAFYFGSRAIENVYGDRKAKEKLSKIDEGWKNLQEKKKALDVKRDKKEADDEVNKAQDEVNKAEEMLDKIIKN